jgi:hypothetical protein
MNEAANLRKELGQILEQWIAAEAEALAARWMIEGKRIPSSVGDRAPAVSLPDSAIKQLIIPFVSSGAPSAQREAYRLARSRCSGTKSRKVAERTAHPIAPIPRIAPRL